MINIENSAKLNNSISYNVINDDLVAKNYLALAYCIAGIKLKNKSKSREPHGFLPLLFLLILS